MPVEDCSRYGSVEVSPAGDVTCFNEKSKRTVSGIINAGVYVFETEFIRKINPEENVSLEMDLMARLVGKDLQGVIGRGPFIDIGTPESYSMATDFFQNIEVGNSNPPISSGHNDIRHS